MSINRLHFNKIQEFKDWLETQGWEEEPTKGTYEEFRMTHLDYPVLLVHRKMNAEVHCTLHGEAEHWFTKWLHTRIPIKSKDAWIDITKEKPKSGTYILICGPNFKWTVVAKYDPEGNEKYPFDIGANYAPDLFSLEAITHWSKCPNPKV